MKKLYFLVILCISTLSFGQNLTVNGDFESWTGGVVDSWTTIDPQITVEEESVIFSEGAKSAKFTVNSQTQADTDFRQTINVTAGVTYDVSFDAYQLDNESRARLYVDGYLNYSDDTMLNTWQTVTNTFTATTTGTIEIGLRFYDTAANWTGVGSVMYIDNFQFTAQSTPSIAIVSPTDGSTVSTTDVDVTLSVQNFNVANVGMGDGHISYTVDAGGATMKYDTTPISLTGLTAGAHTVYVELVDDSDNPIAPAANATVNFTVSPVVTVTTIAEIRADVIANGAGGFYELTGEAIVTYARATRNQKYIQDATAAILIDDNAGIITNTFNVGDGMTGFKGQTSTYSGVLQIIPMEDIAPNAPGFSITPEVVTVDDLVNDMTNNNYETYESELVKINGVTFADGNGSNTFTVNTNYDITDTNTMTFRSMFAEADYVVNADLIPVGATDIIVLAARFNTTPQVVARDLADVTMDTKAFNAIDGLKMYPNPVTGNTLYLASANNSEMSIQIFDILGKEVKNTKVMNNQVNISSLNAGVYIVKITEADKTATRKLIVR